MMERVYLEHGFGPFWRPDSRILILGSFPSAKSRECGFFYGHPRNRFWPLMARLCGEDIPVTVKAKKALLEHHGIALYDVLERCSIVGSSDSSIRDVEPAKLSPILSGSTIGGNIFVNGTKAYSLYQRHILPALGIQAVRLPSTSPANAACSLEDLVRIWGETLEPVIRRKT